MTDRKYAKEVARSEWKARMRAEQLALKESAIQRSQVESAERHLAEEVARAVRRDVPRSVRMAHRRAQLFRPERLRVQLYLSPDEVAELHEWFEGRCGGSDATAS